MISLPYFQQISTFLGNLTTAQALAWLTVILTIFFTLLYIESRLNKAQAARERLRIKQSAKQVQGTVVRFGSSVEDEYRTRYTFQLSGDPKVYTTLSGGYDMCSSAVLTSIGDHVSFYWTPEAEHVFEFRRA
jgi:hypothetical protein